MRLIDADKFYINYARRFSREPLKVEFFKQFLDAEPTVCDIEQIRAEIYETFMTIDGGVHDKSALKCMDIIDKYKAESEDEK